MSPLSPSKMSQGDSLAGLSHTVTVSHKEPNGFQESVNRPMTQ